MSSSFFTYKGYPLVRHDNVIYYGNLEIASKIKVYQMSTDLTLPPNKAITKSSEKESLYEALDLANAWLKRTVKS